MKTLSSLAKEVKDVLAHHGCINNIDELFVKIIKTMGLLTEPNAPITKEIAYESAVQFDITQYNVIYTLEFMGYLKEQLFINDYWFDDEGSKGFINYVVEFTWTQLDGINKEFNEEDYMADLDVLDERIHNWMQAALQRYS